MFIRMSPEQRDVAFDAVNIITASYPHLGAEPDWSQNNDNPSFEEAFPNTEQPDPMVADLAWSIYQHVRAGQSKEPAEELRVMEAEKDQHGLFIRNDEEAWSPVEPVANMARALVEYFGLRPLTFTWGSFSPHDAYDEFTGGSAFIAPARPPQFFSAKEWGRRKLALWEADQEDQSASESEDELSAPTPG